MDNVLKEIKGTFDGEKMIVENGCAISVGGNYASKSKLLVGTKMTYYITTTRSLFKQTYLPPSRTSIGIITMGQDDKLKVKIDVDGREYLFSLLKEFITYFKLKKGDEVVAVYQEELSDKGEHWCIIENKL